MRLLLIILLFIPISIFGQLNREWKPLPEVKGTKAFINKRPATFTPISLKKEVNKVSEIYSSEQPEFISIVKPRKIEPKFISYPLLIDQTIDLPNGMIFKDLSTSNIKYLDKAHGLFGNVITSVVENKDGLMFLGGEKGLVRYNGSELTVFRGLPEFSFRNIRSLFYDSKDRLWIATDVGVCYILNNQIFVPDQQIFGPSHLKGFNENLDTNELLIFTRFNGVFILNENVCYQYFDGLYNTAISSAMRSSDGRLWLASGVASGGLGYIEKDSLFVYRREGGYNVPTCLYEYDNEIWCGVFVGSMLKHRNDSLFIVQTDSLVDKRTYSITSNKKGLWFNDYGNGLYLIKNNMEYVHFDQSIGLGGKTPFSLLNDSYQNIWVADTYTGISRIDENIIYKSNKKLGGNKITDIEIDPNGRTWYFMGGGYVTFEDDHGYTMMQGNNRHNESGLIKNGNIWMSSAERGLTKLSNNEFTHHAIKEKLEFDSTIYSIQLDDRGNIWGWNFANKLYRYKDQKFYDYSQFQPWKKIRFIDVVGTNQNIVFALTANNGVIAIKDGNYIHFHQGVGLLSNQISHVFEDNEGNIWFCMSDKIQIFINQKIQIVLESNELVGNSISDMIQFNDSTFISTTAKGILKITKINGNYHYKLYGKDYGLHVAGNSLIKKNAMGELLIGGKDVLLRYDPYFLKDQKAVPKLNINRIILNDSTIIQTEKRIVIEQNEPISFIFNSINWGSTSNLFYQLNQQSNVGKWNQVPTNTVTFNELTYGDYNLQVYAKGNQLKSETYHIEFSILPIWYQTRLYKIVFFVLVTFVIMGIVWYREILSRNSKRKLIQLVDEKTAELQIEKKEVDNQLEQKEVLMQEVHHRVKNNLTFLKSLLYLRANASDDKDVKIILDECQSRIHSMALVHQNLYDVEDASKVDFNLFLKELFFELENMFDKSQSEISVDIDAKDIKIDMRLSVFLGLILNELITNTYKYAFVDSPIGSISIILVDNGDEFNLIYSDSGHGLQDGFKLQAATGFGFKLINILLNQLNAKMSYENNEMSTFNILIPK